LKPDRGGPAAVKQAAWELRAAEDALAGARAVRRRRVVSANTAAGMGLGEIADILDVSRSQAQQLRDAGKAEVIARTPPGSADADLPRRKPENCDETELGTSGHANAAIVA
jgi:hypothetical protein